MSLLKNRAFTVGLSCIFVLPMSALAQWTVGTGAGDYTVENDASGQVPFRIDPGANAGAMFIDQDGDTALGTTTPLNDFNSRLYIADLTPDIAFEDEDLDQIWSFYANGSSIGFCDETSYPQPGGVTVPCSPFFIQTGAPLASLAVASNGYVGMGVQSPPEAKLHLAGDSANEKDVQVLVENSNTANPGIARKLFVIKNDGPAKFSIFGSATDEWAFNGRPNEFRISKQGSGLVEMEVQTGGNMVIKGTLTQGSSRLTKNGIEPVEAQEVLAKVVSLPISEWTYNHDDKGVRHLGPMSEDFFQAFGLGASDKGLTSIDTSGVALAAIKGLHERLQEKDDEIRSLQAQLQDIKTHQEERILQLELMLSEVARNQSSGVRVSAVD